jgi:glycosyltransferase involved in cell wall biosynthesis
MSSYITIITATFNASENLHFLANSLRSQTLNEFDWIIADGGSVDDTVSIIKANSDIVTEFIVGPDFGIYDALNKAISKVLTPYYLVVGADDILNPMAVELYTQFAKNSYADIISANVQTTNNEILWSGRGQVWRFGHLAYVSQHAIGSLIKTSIHSVVGDYSKFYPIAADRFFLRKAIEKHKCTVVSANFVAGIYSCQGISSTKCYESVLDIFKVDYALSDHPFRTALFCLFKYVLSLRRF